MDGSKRQSNICRFSKINFSIHFYITRNESHNLAALLRSQHAVKINIEIMRAFVRFRALLTSNAELSRKLDELDNKVSTQDSDIAEIILAIR